jgi:hypothetical protein
MRTSACTPLGLQSARTHRYRGSRNRIPRGPARVHRAATLAIDSNVAVQSPPQCTGKRWPPAVAERANTTASSFTALRLQYVEDGLVIQISVIIVHFDRVCAIDEANIRWDALSEVSLETIHALL